MIIIEPPRIRKVVPSLRDMANIEDAVWRPVPRWKLYARSIKKRLTAGKSRGNMLHMMKETSKMPSKNEVIEFLGCAMVMLFIISLCFL